MLSACLGLEIWLELGINKSVVVHMLRDIVNYNHIKIYIGVINTKLQYLMSQEFWLFIFHELFCEYVVSSKQ